MAADGRRGAVLALVILAVVALGLVAHGALLLARTELAASTTGALLLQARAGAEAGYAEALASATRAALDTLPRGAEAPAAAGRLGEHPYSGSVRRLGRELWLVSGEGGARGAGWSTGFGGVAWMLDPAARLEAARGVIESAGVGAGAPGGISRGFTVPEEDPVPDGACARWEATLDTLGALRLLPAVARVEPHPAGEPSLGPLGPAGLGEGLEPLSVDRGTPRPAEREGTCDLTDPMNFGDPDRPGGMCGRHLPSRFREGDLTLEGGAGQGLLAVAGSLTLVGTRFDGLLLVGGDLTLVAGAVLRGAARVGGRVRVDASSGVAGSGCRVLRALEAATSRLPSLVPLEPPLPLGSLRR